MGRIQVLVPPPVGMRKHASVVFCLGPCLHNWRLAAGHCWGEGDREGNYQSDNDLIHTRYDYCQCTQNNRKRGKESEERREIDLSHKVFKLSSTDHSD